MTLSLIKSVWLICPPNILQKRVTTVFRKSIRMQQFNLSEAMRPDTQNKSSKVHETVAS